MLQVLHFGASHSGAVESPRNLQAQGLGDMSMLASIEGRVRSALGLVHSKLSVA